jgi:hypothetical protein
MLLIVYLSAWHGFSLPAFATVRNLATELVTIGDSRGFVDLEDIVQGRLRFVESVRLFMRGQYLCHSRRCADLGLLGERNQRIRIIYLPEAWNEDSPLKVAPQGTDQKIWGVLEQLGTGTDSEQKF